MVKLDMQRLLRDFDKSLADFGIEPVPEEGPPTAGVVSELHRYDQSSMVQLLQGLPGLNTDQRAVFDAVVEAAQDLRQNVS